MHICIYGLKYAKWKNCLNVQVCKGADMSSGSKGAICSNRCKWRCSEKVIHTTRGRKKDIYDAPKRGDPPLSKGPNSGNLARPCVLLVTSPVPLPISHQCPTSFIFHGHGPTGSLFIRAPGSRPNKENLNINFYRRCGFKTVSSNWWRSLPVFIKSIYKNDFP